MWNGVKRVLPLYLLFENNLCCKSGKTFVDFRGLRYYCSFRSWGETAVETNFTVSVELQFENAFNWSNVKVEYWNKENMPFTDGLIQITGVGWNYCKQVYVVENYLSLDIGVQLLHLGYPQT